MGGRGASSFGVKQSGRSPLETFKDNARQFNEARIHAKANKASVLEYKDITGQVKRMYWNGATFVDRRSALYEKEHKGVFRAEYKDKE